MKTPDIDENAMITKAQQGDLAAENAVALNYLQLAKSIARSFGIVGSYDSDDLAQYGMLALVRAIHTFNVNGSANFKTYASHCIKNAIVDVIRSADSDVEEVSLDDGFTVKEIDPENIFIQNETSALLMDAISSLLSPTEMDVLKLYLECMSYAEIATELGLERKKVDNTIYSVKKKIRNLLNKK